MKSNLETAFLELAESKLGLALFNSAAAIDDDGWCLIAPYGEWPKTRTYREGNQVKQQKFIQVLDNEAADAMVAKENSFFSKLKRAFVGVPVYKGHGDLNDVDPKAIGNYKEKIKLGVVDQIRKGDRGIEAHFALDNDGADAVAAGYKFPSGFWYVLPNGQRGDEILCRPFKLISVALTPFPNISGVESLANSQGAACAAPASAEQETQKKPDMKLIVGYLIARGIALANAEAPTETAVLEGIQKLTTAKDGEVMALGNEKTTLTTQVNTLTADRDAATKKATDATTALANEQTARKQERKNAASAVVDLAILKGIVTIAARDTEIQALENAADFTIASTGLLAKPATTKTSVVGSESAKHGAALSNETTALQNEYKAAFQEELIATGQNPTKAHDNIMRLPKYSGLALKLQPKG